MMEDTKISVPKDHDESASKTAIRIWEKEVDMYVKQRETYENNKCALYSVIWGQCSEAMQGKIKSDEDYKKTHEDSNGLKLIKVIKGITYKFESQKNIYLALDNDKCTFYSHHQGPEETNVNYMSKFKNTVEVIERYGGNIGDDKVLITEELKVALKSTNQGVLSTATAKQIETATLTARRKSHAIAFLKRTDKHRYGQLVTDLEYQYTRGNDQYPTGVTEAYNLIVNFKRTAVARKRHPGTTRDTNRRENNNDRATTPAPPPDALAFTQNNGEAPPIATIQCYNCQQMGHYASDCSAARVPRTTGGVNLLQCAAEEEEEDENEDESSDDDDDDYDDYDDYDDDDLHFSFHQSDTITLTPAHIIDPNWIFLDSESTVSIFSNERFLKNVRHCGNEHGLCIHSNGGHQDTHTIGDLPGFGPVWHNKGSLANILSLAAEFSKSRKSQRVRTSTVTQ
jgi:hypothetical protein